MSEWFDNQKQSSSNFRKSFQERIEKVNPRRKLIAEETKRLAKLKAIADQITQDDTWLKVRDVCAVF